MMPMLLLFLTHFLGLTQDMFSAQAVGDRTGFLSAIRKLRTLLSGIDANVDPAKISDGLLKLINWLGENPQILAWIKTLLGGLTLNAGVKQTPYALTFNTLGDDDFRAAGIFDNVGGWMTLVQALMALARMLWGDAVPMFPTLSSVHPASPLPQVAVEPAASSADAAPAAPAPAPAAPVDANATA